MPLLHIGRAQILVDREKDGGVGIDKRVGGKATGQRRKLSYAAIPSGGVGRRRAARGNERLVGEERRIESGTGIRVRTILLSAVENSIAGSQYGLRGELPGQTDPRREIIQVRVDETAAAGGADLD